MAQTLSGNLPVVLDCCSDNALEAVTCLSANFIRWKELNAGLVDLHPVVG
jgi:hypothetical protein